MMDGPDLNNNKFVVEGDQESKAEKDYTFHNTTRLSREGIRELLLRLPEIRAELKLSQLS